MRVDRGRDLRRVEDGGEGDRERLSRVGGCVGGGGGWRVQRWTDGREVSVEEDRMEDSCGCPSGQYCCPSSQGPATQLLTRVSGWGWALMANL